MTFAARLTLAAPRGHALAEALRLAFLARGTNLDLAPLQSEALLLAELPPRLTIRRGADPAVILRDPATLLELAEDLHPDQPLHPRDPVRRAEHRQILSRLPILADTVDRLTLATDPRDLDLYAHLIRGQLGQIDPALARLSQGHSLLDLAAAPILWRLDALDRSFETHLLTGHDALRARAEDIARRWPEVLEPALLADWLAWVTAKGGLITRPEAQTDWSAALGPCGPENRVPPAAQRTKLHSIGTRRGIR